MQHIARDTLQEIGWELQYVFILLYYLLEFFKYNFNLLGIVTLDKFVLCAYYVLILLY